MMFKLNPWKSIAGVLILTVGVGALQYNWLGKVSGAERQRLREGLELSLSQLARDFDREITRLTWTFVIFGERDGVANGEFETQYLNAYGDWMTTVPHPGLLRELFLIKRVGSEPPQLLHLQNDAFVASEWPDSLNTLRQNVSEGVPRLQPPLVARPEQPMMVSPELIHRPGRLSDPDATHYWAVALLDTDYLCGPFLAGLAEDYLSADGRLSYSYRIRTDDELALPVCTAANWISGGVDGSAALFGLRQYEEFRGMVPTRAGLRRAFGRGGGGPRRGQLARRGPGPFENLRSQSFWRIEAVHLAGSLDAVVGQARLRNLALGFGILVLLSASTILVLVSAQRARVLARQQLEFVAGVSHELLTPLAGIRGAAQNLADDVVVDRERIRQYGAMIQQESTRLTNMVEQVLAYAAAQAGRSRYAMERLALVDILRLALTDCKTMLASMEVALELPDDLGMVQGDEMALRRVVYNLVDNAVKYAGNGGWLGVRAWRSGTRELAFEVRDHGPGIAPEDRAHLFEPFYRGREVLASVKRGSGLGLSLVATIVRDHGGRIRLESEPGAGCAFQVILPRATEDGEERHE
jgi:signal transduction histidine kinase